MSIVTTHGSSVVQVSKTSVDLGHLAANHIAERIRVSLNSQSCVRVIFAAAPSQAEMLYALSRAKDIDWSRVEAFHMDEYIGLPENAPQRFSEWLKREFFSRVPLGKVHLIEPRVDAERCAQNYADLMQQTPIDIVCLGIGMNGHIAFNDPPANFLEPKDVRIVELDIQSRMQQVEEGLFEAVDDVPTHAVTLSIPRLLRAEHLFCCVPGKIKQAAVTRTLLGPIDPLCPATILREHPNCTIYLDVDSAAGLEI